MKLGYSVPTTRIKADTYRGQFEEASLKSENVRGIVSPRRRVRNVLSTLAKGSDSERSNRFFALRPCTTFEMRIGLQWQLE